MGPSAILPRESGSDYMRYGRLPDDIRHPNLVRLYRHWESMRGSRPIPSRADFDPLALPDLLGHLILIDVLREPLRFRYRLVGSRLTERVGRDMTGRFFDDLPEPAYRQRLLAWHGGVVEEKVPRAGMTTRRLLERWEPYEILTLPLSADGTDVDMTLTGLYYRNA
ncbi:MAG: PAS domain-containing protein [Alphaproteobacteria bacterium]|nr:PAS domain-containing protein [Alphaproteobacteria bacterium]